MQRRFTTLTALAIFLFTGVVFSQTMKVTTYGVSPREVGLSETDIFTSAYNGLTNVGAGTKMYLQVKLAGGRIDNPTFTTIERPSGSKPLFGGTPFEADTSTVVTSFLPDKPGKYVVQVTDGPYTATIIINAAKYIGVLNTVNNVNCQTCHPSYVEKWQQTGHATMLVRGLEGTLSSHYGGSCISCHTTGYNADTTAVNDGFDDLTFTFPTTLTTGTYQSMVDQFPDAMQRANIQCEACHGPASGHFGETKDSRIQVTYDAASCAVCHDDGHYHVYPEQWDYSKHAVATSYPSGPGRESCVRCHTAKGFAQYAKGISTTDPYFDPSYQPITCAGCHDPHDVTNPNQIRKMSAKLANGVEITDGGKGLLCMNCHQSRTNANDAYVAPKTSYTRFGTHYSDPADIINGQNVYTFGATLGFTDHIKITENGCVTCHMAAYTVDPDLHIQLAGKHTFSMSTPGGQDNMQACATCHGSSLGASFDDVRYFPGGRGDLDQDGTIEGIQAEIHGLLDACAALLPLKNPSDWSHEDPTSAWTQTQLMAFYNMKAIYYDGSFGIHNPEFIYTLLIESYRQLGGVVGVEDEQQTVPTEYALYNNYPNPFNPSTNIKFALPKASNVKLVIYDAIGREVRTLVNNELTAGTHTIAFNANNLASGVYLYKIEAGDFVKVNKMLLVK